jgi:hypothetical protein
MRLHVLAGALALVCTGCGSGIDTNVHMNWNGMLSGLGAAVSGIFSSTTPGTSKHFTAPTATPSGPGFSPAADMAVARGLHTATLCGDGRVLITGGVATSFLRGASYVSEPEIYDPKAGAFTKTSDLAGSAGYMYSGNIVVVRVFHAAAELADGRVLICGGRGVEHADASGPLESDLATAHVFDPKTNAFTQVGSLGEAHHGLRASRASDGSILVRDGAPGTTPTFAAIFDPETATFAAAPLSTAAPIDAAEAVAPLEANRESYGVANSGTDILVAGGVAPSGTAFTTLATADFFQGTTTPTSFTMSHGRCGCAVTPLPNGSLLVSGGFEYGSTLLGVGRAARDPPVIIKRP